MSAVTFDRLDDRKRSQRNGIANMLPIASKVSRSNLRAIVVGGLKFAAGSIAVVALLTAIVALRVYMWWPAYAH